MVENPLPVAHSEDTRFGRINEKLAARTKQTEHGYVSTVGMYGGTLKEIDKKTVWDMRGKVVQGMASLAERGRLVLHGDEEMLELPTTLTTKLRPLLSLHNNVRLGATKDNALQMRQLVVTACKNAIAPPPTQAA